VREAGYDEAFNRLSIGTQEPALMEHLQQKIGMTRIEPPPRVEFRFASRAGLFLCAKHLFVAATLLRRAR
jgi:hypothetical protein